MLAGYLPTCRYLALAYDLEYAMVAKELNRTKFYIHIYFFNYKNNGF